MYQQNKNIIYSCWTCPEDKQPKFLDLHVSLLKKYSNKIGCDFKIISNPSKEYKPPVFVVYEAYKHFAESDYDKMLWIDWDVMISLDSPDIFKEYEDVEFCSWKWSESENNKMHPDLDNHEESFINHICESSFTDDLKELFTKDLRSGGVMIFSNKAMNSFLFGRKARWDKLYDRICFLRNNNIGQHDDLLNLGGVLSHYVINYLLHVNNIPLTNLDKKWNTNSFTNNMLRNEYFFNFNCGGDELENGIAFDEKDYNAMKYVVNNKDMFFDNNDEYSSFVKKFDYRAIIQALKK